MTAKVERVVVIRCRALRSSKREKPGDLVRDTIAKVPVVRLGERRASSRKASRAVQVTPRIVSNWSQSAAVIALCASNPCQFASASEDDSSSCAGKP